MVQNGDRNLTTLGGNPNLLWNPADGGSLVVIDHNLAFDPDFSAKDFVDLHVFADKISPMFSDFWLRDTFTERYREALGIWEEACDNLPQSWMYLDPDRTVLVEFPFVRTRVLFDRAFTDTFWVLPP